MKVEKEYRLLENIDEIRIYNARKKDFYNPTPQEFDIEDIPIQEFINNLPIEIHTSSHIMTVKISSSNL